VKLSDRGSICIAVASSKPHTLSQVAWACQGIVLNSCSWPDPNPSQLSALFASKFMSTLVRLKYSSFMLRTNLAALWAKGGPHHITPPTTHSLWHDKFPSTLYRGLEYRASIPRTRCNHGANPRIVRTPQARILLSTTSSICPRIGMVLAI
jgi:hypothetical protein